MDKIRKFTAHNPNNNKQGKSVLIEFISINMACKSLLFLSILYLCLFNPLASKAQADDDEDQTGYLIAKQRLFYAGLIGGCNFAQVDGDNFAGYYKFGLNVGGIGYIRLFKRVSLSWEILYSQKGSQSDMMKPSGIDTVSIKNYSIDVKYAEIPIMINVFDKLKSHVGIGFSYNRLVSSDESMQLTKNYPVNLYNYPFAKDEWEIIAGAQLHIVKGFFVNLRYQYSLTPMRTNSPPDFSRSTSPWPNQKWAQEYNNLWTLRVMYLFM